MDTWKEERLGIIKDFFLNKRHIILRGSGSWNYQSDVDVLCPDIIQDKTLIRYNHKNVKIDVFKTYTIKKFIISYEKLKPYIKNQNNEINDNIESFLFFLKDYLHLSSYRKEKHIFYSKPINIDDFAKDIGCSKYIIYFLKPSSSIFNFTLRSIMVKLLYYIRIK